MSARPPGAGPRAPGERGPRLVRPYALVGGRTRSGGADLPIEALVVAARGAGSTIGLTLESRAIVEWCGGPRSIAEIAAFLRVPLGVARVLVSDLAGAGYVRVHGDDRPEGGVDVDLLKRVLDGIRDL